MKLQAFLYLLIRDEVTIGKVESIMQGLQPNADEGAKFSCPELAKYAKGLKERLLDE
ncbi:MAG: hypothetical protein MUP27_09020 [Desulfobacterales bacterium]|nr:hypothetical protein [Desulfobacterales bacterium]